ncbi:MAG: SpoIIE family protein phosphatase [Chloroflexota bacterium]
MTTQVNRLLIADDNEARRSLLRDTLTAQGTTVDLASDGQEAVNMVDATRYDMVLLSVQLPKLNGYQVLEHLKTDDKLESIPVLVLSSAADVDSVGLCIELGADDFVQEPYTSELLNMRIRITMQKHDIEREQNLHIQRIERLADQMENVILPMGIALSTEPDFDKLAQRILVEAKDICNADAGTLYMRTGDNSLRFAIVLTESLGIHLGGTSGKPVNFPPLPLYDRVTGEPNIHNVASYVALNGKSINIPNIYEAEGFDFSATKVFDQKNNYRSVSNLTVPLKDNKGAVIGVLQLLNSKDTDGSIVPFDEYNRLVVESLSSQAAVVLNNHMLVQQQSKMNKIENDIQIARRIQTNFLPNTLPVIKGWEIGGRFQPAREVAGDFYDFFMMMGERRLGIIIADVCDKGVGAALFMSLMRSLLRAFAMMSHNVNWAESLFEEGSTGPSFSVKSQAGRLAIRANALKTSVVNTNEYITEHHLDLNMFATMFFGMLDPATGTLLYINGGHPPVMIIAPDGTIKARLEPTGPAVGMFPGAEFEIMDAHLDYGDILFGFTDGVTDARNPAGKLYHEEGLLGLIHPPLDSANGLLDRVDHALSNYIGDAVQFDDITMVAARRLPLDEPAVQSLSSSAPASPLDKLID